MATVLNAPFITNAGFDCYTGGGLSALRIVLSPGEKQTLRIPAFGGAPCV